MREKKCLDGFPFEEIRPLQKDLMIAIINNIFCSTKYVHVVEAPTGSGKSPLAVGLGRTLRNRFIDMLPMLANAWEISGSGKTLNGGYAHDHPNLPYSMWVGLSTKLKGAPTHDEQVENLRIFDKYTPRTETDETTQLLKGMGSPASVEEENSGLLYVINALHQSGLFTRPVYLESFFSDSRAILRKPFGWRKAGDVYGAEAEDLKYMSLQDRATAKGPLMKRLPLELKNSAITGCALHKTFIVVPRRDLQDQYEQDFGSMGVSIFKGKSNYVCGDDPERPATECSRNKLKGGVRENCSDLGDQCEYNCAVADLMRRADTTVCNYASLMSALKTDEWFLRTLVVDEAHEFAKFLVDKGSARFNLKQLLEYLHDVLLAHNKSDSPDEDDLLAHLDDVITGYSQKKKLPDDRFVMPEFSTLEERCSFIGKLWASNVGGFLMGGDESFEKLRWLTRAVDALPEGVWYSDDIESVEYFNDTEAFEKDFPMMHLMSFILQEILDLLNSCLSKMEVDEAKYFSIRDFCQAIAWALSSYKEMKATAQRYDLWNECEAGESEEGAAMFRAIMLEDMSKKTKYPEGGEALFETSTEMFNSTIQNPSNKLMRDFSFYEIRPQYEIKFEDGVLSLSLKNPAFPMHVIAKKFNHVVFLSGTMNTADFAKTMKLPAAQTALYNSAPTISYTHHPLAYIGSKKDTDMSSKVWDKNIDEVCRRIYDMSNFHRDWKGLVHTQSRRNAEALFNFLKEHTKGKEKVLSNPTRVGRFIFHFGGPKDEIIDFFLNKKALPYILVSPSLAAGFDGKGDIARWQIVMKIPYAPVNTPEMQSLLKQKDGEMRYVKMVADDIAQMHGRVNRGSDGKGGLDYGITYVVDGGWDTFLWRLKSTGAINIVAAPFREAISRMNEFFYGYEVDENGDSTGKLSRVLLHRTDPSLRGKEVVAPSRLIEKLIEVRK